MENSNSLSVKAHFQTSNSFRRFSANRNSSFAELKTQISQYLPPNTVIDALQYTDDEGDWVSVDTEEEWTEALFAQSKKPNNTVLKINVFNKKSEGSTVLPQQQIQAQPQQQQQQPQQKVPQLQQPTIVQIQPVQQPQQLPKVSTVVHYGVTCDGCGQSPIRGDRHKCTSCPDYDLCGACLQAMKHPQHNFTTYHVPVHTHIHNQPKMDHAPVLNFGIICDGCKKHNFPGMRYKCMQCPDFDLCLGCFQRGTHSFHNFKIITPSVVPGTRADAIPTTVTQIYTKPNTTVVLAKSMQQQPAEQKVQEPIITADNVASDNNTATTSTTTPIIVVADDQKTSTEDQWENITVKINDQPKEEEKEVVVEQQQQQQQQQQLEEPKIEEEIVVVKQQEQEQEPEVQVVQQQQQQQQQEDVEEYDIEAQMLGEMGFNNRDLCITLLKKYKGDLGRVVAEYFSAQEM